MKNDRWSIMKALFYSLLILMTMNKPDFHCHKREPCLFQQSWTYVYLNYFVHTGEAGWIQCRPPCHKIPTHKILKDVIQNHLKLAPGEMKTDDDSEQFLQQYKSASVPSAPWPPAAMLYMRASNDYPLITIWSQIQVPSGRSFHLQTAYFLWPTVHNDKKKKT